MAQYESEHTRFMREWLAQHPEAVEAQKEGRALWWDKPQEPETEASGTPQKSNLSPSDV